MRGTSNETCMFYSLLFILSWHVRLAYTYSNAWTVRMNEVGHVRSPLVRAVYLRMKEDERQRNDDHQYVGIVCGMFIYKIRQGTNVYRAITDNTQNSNVNTYSGSTLIHDFYSNNSSFMTV